MRLVNAGGRLGILVSDGFIDVETASAGMFPADPQAAYERWAEFSAWAVGFVHDTNALADQEIQDLDSVAYGPPVPRPRQILAVGLNYRSHAEETGLDLPTEPMVFTKFPSAITGPTGTIGLPKGSVDFEAELVVVIGTGGRSIPEENAWEAIAGLTIGQDLSERETQLRPPAPAQFNLGKSYEGFAPIGPYLVTPDELPSVDNLKISCALNGEVMQSAQTGEFVFSIPKLISSLSDIVALCPGDLIFTGTPGGIGWMREPKRMINHGDELVTTIEGLGEMRHSFASARAS